MSWILKSVQYLSTYSFHISNEVGKAKDVAGDIADYSGRIGSLLDSVEAIMTEAQRSNTRSNPFQLCVDCFLVADVEMCITYM